jgi:cation diffusion facilitator CzcD-associated flavoprotein CzcO
LAGAKTYIEVNPSAKVLVLEAGASIGGVWAEHRLYPDLKSNNILGTYEYSDLPMDDTFGVKPGEHIPGDVVHKYLRRYAEKFDVYRRIRLQSKVETVEKQE